MSTTITVYTLSVKVEVIYPQHKKIIDKFIERYYTSKGIQATATTMTPDTEYVSRIGKSGLVYLLHKNQFIHLIHHLKETGQDLGTLTRVDTPDIEPVRESYPVRPNWVPYDYQEEIINKLVDNPVGSKLVTLQTGGGKTVLSMVALSRIGMRIGLVLPAYLDKWQGDIVRIHDSKPSDIMVVSGGKSVRAIMAMGRDNEIKTKYIIFSGRTVQDFISAYERDPEQTTLLYGGTPFELFTLCGIGSLLIDETHQQFHAVFKTLLYANVRFQLGLSATLLSDDEVVTRAHRIVYPAGKSYTVGELKCYTDVYALEYYIPEQYMRKVKTTNRGSNNYSHSAFENSILKDRSLLKFYIETITGNVEVLFLDRYEQDDVCLVFVGTIKMATLLTGLYRKMLPHLRINRYCEDDPEENLHNSDVIVSTVQSSGTAVDIANLRVVMQSVNVSSTPQNIQNLGRLRELKHGKDTRFAYLFAGNIRKQVNYHKRRVELFSSRVKSHRTFRAKTSTTLQIPPISSV